MSVYALLPSSFFFSFLINMSASSLDRVWYTQASKFSLLHSPMHTFNTQMFDANQTLREKKKKKKERERERETTSSSSPFVYERKVTSIYVYVYMYVDRKTTKMNVWRISNELKCFFLIALKKGKPHRLTIEKFFISSY